MSREIDMEDPGSWDEDDIRYLGERDRLPADMLDQYQPKTPQQMNLDQLANTGDANTAGISKDEHEARVAASAEDEDDEGLELPYEQHTNDELRAELARRDLEVSGNKAELIERLEDNDAETEAE